ncbi:MAG: hybrid sensor histidine kinase/response regulator [Pirellulales bacterium]
MVDDFLLDLFRQEVNTNAQTLNNGLVQLEQDPGNARMIEPLMRAAHSIKGAARVVGFDLPVRLAHVMEDCLVKAQEGELTLGSGDIDALLQGVDLLVQIAAAAGPGWDDWSTAHTAEVESLRDRLDAISRGESATSPAAVAPALAEQPGPTVVASVAAPNPPESSVAAPVSVPEARTPAEIESGGAGVKNVAESVGPAAAVESHERVVRVTAQNLTRLMGLAGESLVEARWLQPFSDSLHHLKTQQSKIGDELDELLQTLPVDSRGHRGRELVGELRRRLNDCEQLLSDRIVAFENHARRSDDLNSRLYREVIASRMRPFRDGVQGFPRLVRDLARQLNKKAQLEIVGEMTEVDREILEKLDAPLNHLLRNALDHGLELPDQRRGAGKPETGTLRLEARHVAGMLAISLSDDGRGVDLERLREKVVSRKLTSPEMASRLSPPELLEFLFLPGFSTAEAVTEVSGRGVGLDVVHSMVTAVGGQVRIDTRLGQGTTFHIQLPLTLSVIRAVLVKVAGESYAFPHNRIDGLVRIPVQELRSIEDRQFLERDGENIGVVLASQVLQLSGDERMGADAFVVLFSNRGRRYGVIVDRFEGEQDLVVRTLDGRLGKVPDIAAAAILDDGTPVLIVDLDDLHRSIERLLEDGHLKRAQRRDRLNQRKRRILVVDDSITVREVERQLLAGQGYDVETAVDGVEGWNMVREHGYDLVVSDIDMPRMNGIELVRKIKSEPRLHSIPVIIVSYKDRQEDRRQGLEAGANFYLTKSSFHDETLVDAVRELIGSA